MIKRDLPGYAIGGLAGGEDKDCFWRVVGHNAKRLPSQKPRYLMGVGYPLDLVVCVCLGVDMFDCVYPTRTARFGVALVGGCVGTEQQQGVMGQGGYEVGSARMEGEMLWPTGQEGTFRLKAHVYSRDMRPVGGLVRRVNKKITSEAKRRKGMSGAVVGQDQDPRKGEEEVEVDYCSLSVHSEGYFCPCPCSTCKHYTRAALHRMFKDNNPLASQLLTVHNVCYMMQLMRSMRRAVLGGEYMHQQYVSNFIGEFFPLEQGREVPLWVQQALASVGMTHK